MSRPKGDLSALVVPKGTAAGSAPFQEPATAPAPATPQVSSPSAGWPEPQTALTVKLDQSIYFKLKDYCLEMQKLNGRRMTHQNVVARALAEFLEREGA